ncbi:hypothetical protein H072_3087 [Dactylellina haptotyla CBS 200.50]|uniref:NACHT domain-containing protein n=1 Tax=Dactylellina haptotyla (strain CBS 200.50) TaxID=1284197 RepID=S8C5K9_DACHA|nr:hypothetical protein H072_3087 [Dactylellina haptotyla CBS 200.50]
MSVTVGQQEFEKAVADFISVLKSDDKKALSASDPTAEDVANLVKQIDNTLRPKQKRRILRNSLFETLLVSIQQFYGVIDSCTQSNPEIASLVWGGMKFLILAFSNYVEYFEKIIGMCDEMGKLCPQYNRFAQLFPNHLELQSCIFEFYGVVVGFFKEASLFLYRSVLKQFAIAIFQPFRDKFNVILKSLGILKERIENEIWIAENQEAHTQRVRDAQNWATTENHFALARIAYHDFQEDRLKVSKYSRQEMRNRVLDNISSYSYYSDFANNLQKRLPNSGQWIFELPEYKAWVEPSQSAGIWYHAIPGFGKSVLTAGVIDNLIESSKSARNRQYVTYFFCTYTNASSLLAHTIIASLLRQLFYYSSDLPLDLAQTIESSFRDRISSARVDRLGLRGLLNRILETNQAHNFIIIDGLDECNDVERGIVLRTLKELLDGAVRPDGLKILVSSRGSQDIMRALKNFKQVDLGTSNQQDIECFVEQAIKDKELEGQLPELPNDLFQKIKEFLTINAKGLFIWVDLLILEICKESRVEDIEMALPTLPRDLDELYNRVLHRIETLRKPEIARKIFRWVAYARRPLTLKELKEATVIEEPSVSSWAVLNRMTEIDDAKWL